MGRDYYVRLDASGYSVDPVVTGRFVDVSAGLARVEVRHQGRLVAAHDRAWARGMTITDPAYVAAAKALREQFQQPRPAPTRMSRWCGTWPSTTAPSAWSTSSPTPSPG